MSVQTDGTFQAGERKGFAQGFLYGFGVGAFLVLSLLLRG